MSKCRRFDNNRSVTIWIYFISPNKLEWLCSGSQGKLDFSDQSCVTWLQSIDQPVWLQCECMSVQACSDQSPPSNLFILQPKLLFKAVLSYWDRQTTWKCSASGFSCHQHGAVIKECLLTKRHLQPGMQTGSQSNNKRSRRLKGFSCVVKSSVV